MSSYEHRYFGQCQKAEERYLSLPKANTSSYRKQAPLGALPPARVEEWNVITPSPTFMRSAASENAAIETKRTPNNSLTPTRSDEHSPQGTLMRIREILDGMLRSKHQQHRSGASRFLTSEYLEQRVLMSGLPIAAEIGAMTAGVMETESQAVLEQKLAELKKVLEQIDAEISSIPTVPVFQWNASKVQGWNGELSANSSVYMQDSIVTSSGKFLVAGFQNGIVEIRNTKTGQVSAKLQTGISVANSLSANPTNDSVYVSVGHNTGNGILIAIDAAEGKELWRTKTGGATTRSSVSMDGKKVHVDVQNNFIDTQSRSVKTFDTKTGKLLTKSQRGERGGTAIGTAMTFFRSGDELWIQSIAGSRQKLTTLAGVYNETAISPDQTRVAIGGHNGVVAVINVATKKEMRWMSRIGTVNEIAFANDTTLVVAHDGGTVAIWNVSGKTPVLTKTLQAGNAYIHGMDIRNGILVLRTGKSPAMWHLLDLVDHTASETKRTALNEQRTGLLHDIALTEIAIEDAKIIESERLKAQLEAERQKQEAIDERRISDESQKIADNLAALLEAERYGNEEVLAPVKVKIERLTGSVVEGINITSPLDESYLDAKHWGVVHASHPGGANNLMIFNNYLAEMMENERGSRSVTWTLYADKELQVPLVNITFVGNRNAVTMLSAIALPVRRNLLPPSKEYEKVPELHIAHLEGPNAILEASSPIENSTVEIVGTHDDSILGRGTIFKNTDNAMHPVTVMINPHNNSGDYNLLMKGVSGRTYGRILLHWDRDAKKLSLATGEVPWSAPESLKPAIDAAITSLYGSLVDPNTSDRNLVAIQQEILLTTTVSMPGMHYDFDEAFFRTHPEWAPALRERLNPSALNQFSDTYGILRADYGKFQGLLGDLVQQGITLLTQIRRGGNETELRRLFALTVDTYATSFPMYQLASIGIHMPNSGQILEAAKCGLEMAIDQLMTVKNKGAIQQMNRQAYASNGLVVSADGTYMVGNDPRLVSTTYFVDASGRLSLLSPLGNRVLIAGLDSAAGTKTQDILEVDGHIDLGKQMRIDVPNLSLNMMPEGYKVITFELAQDSMVNLDAPGVTDHNLSLTIQGASLPAGGYTSNKAGSSGESVSLKLTSGTYTFTVQDKTDYGKLVNGHVVEKKPFGAMINMDAVGFNSANIEGRISIEGDPDINPVRIRVAEFDPDTQKRKINYEATEGASAISKLDPTKPVWVIAHGRGNSEDSSQIEELARNLYKLGVQVVTVDWEEGADDNLTPLGLEGSKWIEKVGAWSANQLTASEFAGSQINVIGHSWGSYVSYEIGAHIPGGVRTLVALDPAADSTLLGGAQYAGFNKQDFSFSNVAENSYAFHSSEFGNQERALTAEYSFAVVSPESYEETPDLLGRLYQYGVEDPLIDKATDAFHEHGFAVSLFTELLERARLNPNDQTAKLFTPQAMRSNEGEFFRRDGHEGVFYVQPAQYVNDIGSEQGQTKWKAKTFGFRAKDQNGNDIINPRTL